MLDRSFLSLVIDHQEDLCYKWTFITKDLSSSDLKSGGNVFADSQE